MFINCSNHPFEKWEESQINAANQFGRIIDIEFPDVPADADEKTVERIADEYTGKIMKALPAEKNAVMIQGEFTLTYRLVKSLTGKGILVVSACTERVAVERKDPTGKIFKESRYAFVRFRAY